MLLHVPLYLRNTSTATTRFYELCYCSNTDNDPGDTAVRIRSRSCAMRGIIIFVRGKSYTVWEYVYNILCRLAVPPRTLEFGTLKRFKMQSKNKSVVWLAAAAPFRLEEQTPIRLAGRLRSEFHDSRRVHDTIDFYYRHCEFNAFARFFFRCSCYSEDRKRVRWTFVLFLFITEQKGKSHFAYNPYRIKQLGNVNKLFKKFSPFFYKKIIYLYTYKLITAVEQIHAFGFQKSMNR